MGDMGDFKATVLLIDADPYTQEIVCAFFENSGYLVLTAAGIEDGLEMVRRSRPDAVIAEMYTPTGQPPRLLPALRSLAEAATLPIVTVSAHALPEDEERALAAGSDRYLAKPIEPGKVLEAVEALLVIAAGNRQEPAPDGPEYPQAGS